MKPLSPDEVRKAVGGHWLRQGQRLELTGVSIDSRTARLGELFIAIRGRRLDGHAFLAQAGQAGCSAAVVAVGSQPPPAGGFPGGVIAVSDTTDALGRLARYHRHLLSASVIGVTGSNGKTTVKRMIHHILAKRMTGTPSPKSYNNEIGVPLTLLAAGGGDDYVVCEIGTDGPGQVAALAAIAEPDIAVITNVAEAHLEGLGTIETVAAEKASILACLPENALAAVWADSAALDKLAGAYHCRLIRFGESASADLRVTDYRPTDTGQRFQFNDRLWVDLPLPGKHNAVNALAAIAVADKFGFSQAEAAEALGDFEGSEMRLERLMIGEITVINDAYNANPASMLAAARVLAESPARRRVLIAGDMGELGGDSRQLHLRTGGEIAAAGVDLLIGVGPLGRYIAKGAAEAGVEVEAFDSLTAAEEGAADMLHVGDLVLIKASRSVGMERLLEPIRRAFGGGS